ncbi:hypothetical protein BDP27DRAFT_1421910 [Rhodocollybia butyracea]|uniref:C2H2-type domain-containing protein n=1 Tax=Rhodocollybia butyracea TaxID=206335 RepID=A0A9P5U7X5_9AGAR|nr:hypothetical protein BDP27DRAFT_1421910 [Rhodocollybia butyracea]
MARTKIPACRDESLKDPTVCEVCGTKVARKGDLPRHMRRHLSAEDKASKSYACPYPECPYISLQKGNVDTHIRTHTKEKNQKCPSCDFDTVDPGSLTRHRKRRHEYVPKERKPRTPGNGPPNQQQQIIITTPSTFSPQPGSEAVPSSSTSPSSFSPLRLPVDVSGYESDATATSQSTNASSFFSHRRTALDVAGYDSDATTASRSSNPSSYMSVTPPPHTFPYTIGAPSTVPSSNTDVLPPSPGPSSAPFRSRGPLSLRDMLADETEAYWQYGPSYTFARRQDIHDFPGAA